MSKMEELGRNANSLYGFDPNISEEPIVPPTIVDKSGDFNTSLLLMTAPIQCQQGGSSFSCYKSRQSYADRSIIKIISKDGHKNLI